MSNLTPEQRALGRENANRVLGDLRRRDLLKAAAAVPAVGAFYFGYEKMDKSPVRAAIIGTGNEGCEAMIRDHNRDYLDFIGFCDIRPSQPEARRRRVLQAQGVRPRADAKKLKPYDDHKEMLADPDVEVVVIALPLWLHAPDRHRGDEGGQARLLREADGALRQASARRWARSPTRPTSSWRSATSGTTRSSTTTPTTSSRTTTSATSATSAPSGTATTPSPGSPCKDGKPVYDPETGEPEYVRDEKGNIVYLDGWKPDIPDDDQNVDYAKYGYKSLDELVRWRLYNRTGAGLMAELGSHQLDACSIFLGKKHPLAVTGIGGTFFYHRRPRGRRPRLRHLRVPRQGLEARQARQGRPRRRHLLVDQHQLVRQVRRDRLRVARDDDRRGGEGDPPLQGGGRRRPRRG